MGCAALLKPDHRAPCCFAASTEPEHDLLAQELPAQHRRSLGAPRDVPGGGLVYGDPKFLPPVKARLWQPMHATGQFHWVYRRRD